MEIDFFFSLQKNFFMALKESTEVDVYGFLGIHSVNLLWKRNVFLIVSF